MDQRNGRSADFESAACLVNMLIENVASSLEKPLVISTEVVEGAKRRDHAAENCEAPANSFERKALMSKSSAACSTSCLTTRRIGSTFQRYFISNPVLRRCFGRRKISPLRHVVFAAAPSEPCK